MGPSRRTYFEGHAATESNEETFPSTVLFCPPSPRLCLAIGTITAVALPLPRGADSLLHALIGWNVAVYLYLGLVWPMIAGADHEDLRAYAQRQDERGYVLLFAACLAAVMSVAAIVLELATAKAGSPHHTLHLVVTATTVLGSWFLIPTIFGLHYAHMYYLRDEAQPPPLAFPEKGLQPDYWDFMYFSFTIAAASQTAEIAPHSRSMRKTMLAQAVMSFFFNASILALSINISASLVSG